MTETINADEHQRRRGFSSLQKSLFGVLAFFFAIHIVFWFLEFHGGVSHCRRRLKIDPVSTPEF